MTADLVFFHVVFFLPRRLCGHTDVNLSLARVSPDSSITWSRGVCFGSFRPRFTRFFSIKLYVLFRMIVCFWNDDLYQELLGVFVFGGSDWVGGSNRLVLNFFYRFGGFFGFMSNVKNLYFMKYIIRVDFGNFILWNYFSFELLWISTIQTMMQNNIN